MPGKLRYTQSTHTVYTQSTHTHTHSLHTVYTQSTHSKYITKINTHPQIWQYVSVSVSVISYIIIVAGSQYLTLCLREWCKRTQKAAISIMIDCCVTWFWLMHDYVACLTPSRAQSVVRAQKSLSYVILYYIWMCSKWPQQCGTNNSRYTTLRYTGIILRPRPFTTLNLNTPTTRIHHENTPEVKVKVMHLSVVVKKRFSSFVFFCVFLCRKPVPKHAHNMHTVTILTKDTFVHFPDVSQPGRTVEQRPSTTPEYNNAVHLYATELLSLQSFFHWAFVKHTVWTHNISAMWAST